MDLLWCSKDAAEKDEGRVFEDIVLVRRSSSASDKWWPDAVGSERAQMLSVLIVFELSVIQATYVRGKRLTLWKANARYGGFF